MGQYFFLKLTFLVNLWFFLFNSAVFSQSPAISIDYFRSSEISIDTVRAVRFWWKVRFATRVDIYDGNRQTVYSNLIHEDSLEVFPEKTSQYILTAWDEQGRTISQMVTIYVAPPRILQFVASPRTVYTLQPVRLWWRVTYAKRVDIYDAVKNTTYGDLGIENFIEVWPEVSSNYFLHVYGFDGSFTSLEILVNVFRPHSIFDPNLPMDYLEPQLRSIAP